MLFTIKIKPKHDLLDYTGIRWKYETVSQVFHQIKLNVFEKKFEIEGGYWISIDSFLDGVKSGRIIILGKEEDVSH